MHGCTASGAKPADRGSSGLACTHPVFQTSEPNGGWSVEGYYVHKNMWNREITLGPQTTYACSFHDWYVVSNQTNHAGAVKTYPNAHKDYPDTPISSFKAITSTFAEASPHVGIYDVAYDIWTNGVATPGCTEFMIWNENFHQVPSGPAVDRVVFGGRTYDVHTASEHHYIAFVPTIPFTYGTLDILEFLHWAIAKGWLPAASTLGAIDLGVEIVSTDGSPATFRFTDFSITTR